MNEESMPGWQVWLVAVRPFSYTAAIVPVLLGGMLGAGAAGMHWEWLLAAVLGGVFIQAGTNLVNSYYDFQSGVDTPQSFGSTPVLVMGWLRPGVVLAAGYLAFFLAAGLGAYLVAVRGVGILALGVVGIAGGYYYTAGPVSYKYRGLGVPLVFLLMGPLMVAGGYFVQAGRLGADALWASLPVGCLVAAILHGNDLRDVQADGGAGIATLTRKLGGQGAAVLYYGLVGGAYLLLALLLAAGALELWAGLAFLTLPRGLALCRRVRDGVRDNPELLGPVEPMTAQLHLQFGLLMVAGIALGLFI